VRRVVSITLGLLLLLGAVEAPWLHEHDSRDHVHPEHQHGLAAHVHPHGHHDASHAEAGPVAHATRTSRPTRWIDACDAGDHVTRVSLFTTTLSTHALPTADTTPAWQLPFTPTSASRATPLDVRVHGPPARHRLNPRAPPSA
jgi:hypothetical protein